jgi:hypothetical protein
MKQTAVEWLAEQFDIILELYPSEFKKINIAIEQAKQIEKKQIINSYNKSFELRYKPYETAEKYYNKTYEK